MYFIIMYWFDVIWKAQKDLSRNDYIDWGVKNQTSLAQEICTPLFQFFGAVFASKGYPFKNIFDFTTAGDWDCVAAVERLPARHYSVDFIFLSFGIIVFIVEH